MCCVKFPVAVVPPAVRFSDTTIDRMQRPRWCQRWTCWCHGGGRSALPTIRPSVRRSRVRTKPCPTTSSPSTAACSRATANGSCRRRSTRGPWDPNAMHGGAPSALVRARARAATIPGPASFIARLTVELLRPVPLAPLQVGRAHDPARARRCSGSKARCSPTASRSRARSRCGCAPQAVDVARRRSRPRSTRRRRPTAGAPPAFQFFDREHVGYWTANEIRLVAAASASRARRPRGSGCGARSSTDEPVAPFERVAAAADFGSGVGNPLTFTPASRDQPRGDDPRAPAPGRRVGVPRVGRVGRAARRRPRRHVACTTSTGCSAAARRRCSSRRSRDAPTAASRATSARSALRQSSRTRSTSAACSSNSPLRNTSSRAGPRAAAAGRRGCGRRAPRSCAGRPR